MWTPQMGHKWVKDNFIERFYLSQLKWLSKDEEIKPRIEAKDQKKNTVIELYRKISRSFHAKTSLFMQNGASSESKRSEYLSYLRNSLHAQYQHTDILDRTIDCHKNGINALREQLGEHSTFQKLAMQSFLERCSILDKIFIVRSRWRRQSWSKSRDFDGEHCNIWGATSYRLWRCSIPRAEELDFNFVKLPTKTVETQN